MKILSELGLGHMKVDFDGAEIAKQVSDFENEVDISDALRRALGSFLQDNRGSDTPLSIVEQVFPSVDPKVKLIDLLNNDQSGVRLLGPSETPENGETVADYWIFVLTIWDETNNSELSDHAHWALVDRRGVQPTYNYGFN